MGNYVTLVKDILSEYAKFPPSHGQIQSQLIFDDDNENYQLMFIGWDIDRRVHSIVIHIRLINSKIWIEWDGTPEGVALKFLKHGVPREDIVLGFQPPEMRQYTEFAVA
ncbi:XisI protein [Anaerolineales bacterium HSG24]|nr:XisI protein [Anaerolineales bacterium HSG24]